MNMMPLPPPVHDDTVLRHTVVQGQVRSDFLRHGVVAVQVLLTSGVAPRWVAAFVAGNSGAAVWFDADSGPVTWNAGSLNSAGSYAGNVTTSGAQGLASDTFPQTLTANLSSFYNAVGLNFGNDDTCCSSGFSAILTVWSGATNLGSVTVAANMNDFVDQFIGLSSVTAFDRVDISYGSNAELYTFIDDFRLGTAATGAVPEPSTWAMMLLGFGAIGYSMRRRRKSGAVPVFA